MAQTQLPGGGYFNAGVARQSQIPGSGFLGEVPGGVSINVPLGSLALTAFAPTVFVGDPQNIAVPRATLTLVGHAPFVSVTHDIGVPVAALHLTAHAPLVSVGDGATVRATTPRRPGLLLTDPLPLALTSQIGAFAEAQLLPQRYGDLRKTRFKLIRMTATKFIAAGHAMEITRAFTADLETSSFAVSVESSGALVYTVVEFAAPVPIGTDCSASGLGKRHSVTGALIENPADIAVDVLALAGRVEPWFGQLRAEATAIALAGSFGDVVAVRDAIDTVMNSAGAIWCPGMARLYPVPFDGFKIDIDATSAHDLTVQASATDTADIVRLSFDFDEVENRNQSFIELSASPQRYAGKLIDVALPMLRNPATAEAIGRRIAGWYAGERYTVTYKGDADEFARPGTWALLTGHPQWPFSDDPYLMLTQTTISKRENFVSVTAETLRSSPTITITNHSLGGNSIDTGGIEVQFLNGIATFTVLDNSDKPIVGAYVSLDGAAPKKTNGQGQVVFTTTAGAHELAVEAAGFLPYSIGLTL